MLGSGRTARIIRLSIVGLVLAVIAAPASGTTTTEVNSNRLDHLSQAVAVRYWMANPDRAPAQFRDRFLEAKNAFSAGKAAPSQLQAAPFGDRFNDDIFGLPQNEESITACRADPNLVLGGTNDYRGLLNDEGNFTGWHFSTDGGATLANEGLLPPVQIGDAQVPSGGDPVSVSHVGEGGCNFFAASLNYDPVDPFGQANGIGVYLTHSEALATCDTSQEPFHTNPDCWPVRRAVATTDAPHFYDKEWIDVGDTGDGAHVWVVFADFLITGPGATDFTSQLRAVRCTADLVECTRARLISGRDKDIQYGDVTIGSDGRTYVTWVDIRGELTGNAQLFRMKMRVAPAGSIDFGPTMVVGDIRKPLPFGGVLHANDFRIASYPKNEVKLVDGHSRLFVTYDECRARPLASICEEAEIKLTYSDNGGETWSVPMVLSAGGDNYFPSIARNPSNTSLAVTWYTNRFDPQFHNRQDVELITLDGASLTVLNRSRVTGEVSNETEADPLLGGAFIGDYIDVFAHAGMAYVAYNANLRDEQLIGIGTAIPQQDNFLTKVAM